MNNQLGLLKHIPCPRGDACTTYRCLFGHSYEQSHAPSAATPTTSSGSNRDYGRSSGHVPASGPAISGQPRPGQQPTPSTETASPDTVQVGPRMRAKTSHDEYDPAAPINLSAGSEQPQAASKDQPDKAAQPTQSGRPGQPGQPGQPARPGQARPSKPAGGAATDKGVPSRPASASQVVSTPSRKRPLPSPTSNNKRPGQMSSPRPLTSEPKSASPLSKKPKLAGSFPSPVVGITAPTEASSSPSSRAQPLGRKPEALNPRHIRTAPATHEIRLKLLKLLHTELSRLNQALATTGTAEGKKNIILSSQDLIWMALDIEETCAVSKPAIYSNTIKNKVMHYRRMDVSQWSKELVAYQEQLDRKLLDQQRRLALSLPRSEPKPTTKPAAKQSPQNIPKKEPAPPLDTGLTPREEVLFLQANLLTPIDGLANHGYVPAVPSEESIQKAREADEASKGWEKCDRCSTRFQVFPGRRPEDGALTSGGSCTFHPGKAFFPPRTSYSGSISVNGQSKRYRCCGQAVGDSPGCVTNSDHVFKTTDPKRLASLWNFAETPANPNAPTDRAVCFDCEMGYTTYGMELIRVTATAWPTGETLLDVLVRPIGEVIDLNSRYSGVWPEDITNALPFVASAIFDAHDTNDHDTDDSDSTTERKRLHIVSSPLVARDLLFALICPTTPLIGHGLENDLNSMRIVHPTIVDTVLLFPHPKGLPIRYGLKMLVERHLNRLIQLDPPASGDAKGAALGGHDSAEDARAAGDLVRFKIKQEWTTKRADGWQFIDGVLYAPGVKPPSSDGTRLTEAYIER